MTIDELIRFAPDARSLEGARRLFYSRRWRLLAGDGKWIWGEFEVKGNRALHAAVDLLNGRFHCDCRSKRRPCTHALALLLKLKSRPDEWTVSEPPIWVSKLISGNGKNEDKAKSPPKVLDLGSLAPSEDRRQLMYQGMGDLEVRLLDIVRAGFATAASYDADYWLSAAARLTDAQLSGPAARMRRLANPELCTPEYIATVVGDLYLMCAAWQDFDRLETSKKLELYRELGLSIKKDVVLSRPPKNDLWLVMGTVSGVEDRLRYRRVWLRGEQSKRYALIIDYAFGERPFERSWPLASAWSGDLHYYPGSYPRRGIFPAPKPATRAFTGLKGYTNYSELIHNYSRALALQPWLRNYPAYMASVTPHLRNNRLYLEDGEGRAYPVTSGFEGAYTILAVSGGRPASVFNTFNGTTLQPLSIYVDEGLVGL
ncbi:MAG: SWIM zinc finger family protein [Bacteroidota bacterium]